MGLGTLPLSRAQFLRRFYGRSRRRLFQRDTWRLCVCGTNATPGVVKVEFGWSGGSWIGSGRLKWGFNGSGYVMDTTGGLSRMGW
ncbi:hypothetical protein I7I53_11388 [Histoplasma capsulatum var. duboisii H88]|uniref:Uncharacterized protein n=1 Tax=Ajellomyces capsulatus (strain H88) TaxID=544711 RepID=A0A8A1LAH2_AJEC8|nr:hypothetical protein I7I53_11388 [Histoplasma capsulatum var. duboisii H88]